MVAMGAPMAEMSPAVVAGPIAHLQREVARAADKMVGVAQVDMEQPPEAPTEIVAPPTQTLLEVVQLMPPMEADASVLVVVAALPPTAEVAVAEVAGMAVVAAAETGPPVAAADLPTPAP